jgi:hypothetical protein
MSRLLLRRPRNGVLYSRLLMKFFSAFTEFFLSTQFGVALEPIQHPIQWLPKDHTLGVKLTGAKPSQAKANRGMKSTTFIYC